MLLLICLSDSCRITWKKGVGYLLSGFYIFNRGTKLVSLDILLSKVFPSIVCMYVFCLWLFPVSSMPSTISSLTPDKDELVYKSSIMPHISATSAFSSCYEVFLLALTPLCLVLKAFISLSWEQGLQRTWILPNAWGKHWVKGPPSIFTIFTDLDYVALVNIPFGLNLVSVDLDLPSL